VQLGEVVGISYQGFQKYESGESVITAPRLMAIAETLGVPIGYFFDTQNTNTVDDDMQIAIVRLARKLKQIERRRPERFRKLRDSINALAKGKG
jgi:transcriptional regulator with XRE-family HTH domain